MGSPDDLPSGYRDLDPTRQRRRRDSMGHAYGGTGRSDPQQRERPASCRACPELAEGWQVAAAQEEQLPLKQRGRTGRRSATSR